MKNKIIRYLIVIFCVLAILFALVKVLKPDNKFNTYLAIGDYLSVSGNLRGEKITSFSSLLGDYFVENKLVDEVNTSYTSSSINSTLLLEMINKDAYTGNDNGLVSLIKDSRYITISVGMNDIIQYIRFDSNNQEIVYDKEFIKRKLEIMKQNYYEIIDEIGPAHDKKFTCQVKVDDIVMGTPVYLKIPKLLKDFSLTFFHGMKSSTKTLVLRRQT